MSVTFTASATLEAENTLSLESSSPVLAQGITVDSGATATFDAPGSAIVMTIPGVIAGPG